MPKAAAVKTKKITLLQAERLLKSVPAKEVRRLLLHKDTLKTLGRASTAPGQLTLSAGCCCTTYTHVPKAAARSAKR